MTFLHVRNIVLSLAVLWPATSSAEAQICENALITVKSPDAALLDVMCDASDRALALIDQCELIPPDPITITVADIQPASCLGLFHCGEARIEVLSPDLIEARRSETGVFKHIDASRLFQSVIVHELSHAAMDNTPCPVQNCLATSEYFAYTLQLLDLSKKERATVVGPEPSEPSEDRIKHDQINAMILLMAPDIFVGNVWGHVTARGDICTQLRAVQDGIVVFDRFHP